jgi:hypothetical protein
MATYVVHCKKQNFDIYIGRAHSDFPEGSPFCNPFIIGKDGARNEVIEKYEEYLRQALIEIPGLDEELLKLDGKILGCWCFPKKCHGDIIVKLIKEIKRDRKMLQF